MKIKMTRVRQKINLVPFFLAPCAGDLTLIDALHGIKARTIRGRML